MSILEQLLRVLQRTEGQTPIFLPGESHEQTSWTISLSDDHPDGICLESHQETIIVGPCLGGGYGGRVYELLGNAKRRVQKIFKPLSRRKEWTRDAARLITTQDHPWLIWESIRASLARKLLSTAHRVSEGHDAIVQTDNDSVTLTPGMDTYGLDLEFCDGRDPRHGPMTKEGTSEIKERAGAQWNFIKFFEKCRADGLRAQVNCYKHEPHGNWYIWLTGLVLLALLAVVLVPYIPRLDSIAGHLPIIPFWTPLAWAVLMITVFAGASWMTADNLRKCHDHWWLQDTEMGMPHVACCPPLLLLVGACIAGLWKLGDISFWRFGSLTTNWLIFFALLFSPGYLFLFEIPMIFRIVWKNIKTICVWITRIFYRKFKQGKVYQLRQLITFGEICIDEFEAWVKEREAKFREVLGDDEYDTYLNDIELYRRVNDKFQAGRLNIINRILYLPFFLIKLIFFWKWDHRMFPQLSAMRERAIERWALKRRISPGFALRLLNYPFLYMLYLPFSFIPWRLLRGEHFRWRFRVWKTRQVERMYYKEQLTLERALALVDDKKNLRHILLSMLLRGKIYRFWFDQEYRRELLSKISLRKNVMIRVSNERFERFIIAVDEKGNIDPVILSELEELKNRTEARGLFVMCLMLWAPKVVTVPATGVIVAGGAGTGGRDIIKGVPGWLAGLVGSYFIKGIYKITVIASTAYLFNIRIVPRTSWEERSQFGKKIMTTANVIVFTIFALLHFLPTVSVYSALIAATFSPYRRDFQLLTTVKVQSTVEWGVKKGSLGMWNIGGLGQSYFRRFIINSLARILKTRYVDVVKWKEE